MGFKLFNIVYITIEHYTGIEKFNHRTISILESSNLTDQQFIFRSVNTRN